MKRFKKLLYTLLGMLGVFIVFTLWYTNKYAMEEVKAFEVNDTHFSKKLLIATQGSDFKNTITAGLVEYFKGDSVYIKVIDVSELEKIDPDAFDAIALIHTWENWKPPPSVRYFIDNNQNAKNKMVILTTSGEGSYKMDEVDALTGESIVEEAPAYFDKIIDRLKPLLEN